MSISELKMKTIGYIQICIHFLKMLFQGTGYDRGHLAAAGNHRRSQLAMDQTFYLTNMSPQIGRGFNRDKWNDLEKHVRRTARKSLNTYVVTGPLYLAKVEADGNSYIKYKVNIFQLSELINFLGDRQKQEHCSSDAFLQSCTH